MSQYDFGTIDPYVTDGVQLADMLNQWRNAINTMHRGASRPSYAVPGTMWINDSGGATNWIVNVFLGGGAGDKALTSFNTTTGAVALAADFIEARAASSPAFSWNATGNPASQQLWRAYETGTGRLRFGAYDGAVETGYLEFARDGSLVGPSTGGMVAQYSVVTAQPGIYLFNLGKRCVDISFHLIPTAASATLYVQTVTASTINTGATYYTQQTLSLGATPSSFATGPIAGFTFGVGAIGNAGYQGIAGKIHFPDLLIGKGTATINSIQAGGIYSVGAALSGPGGDGIALAFSPGGNISAGVVKVIGY